MKVDNTVHRVPNRRKTCGWSVGVGGQRYFNHKMVESLNGTLGRLIHRTSDSTGLCSSLTGCQPDGYTPYPLIDGSAAVRHVRSSWCWWTCLYAGSCSFCLVGCHFVGVTCVPGIGDDVYLYGSAPRKAPASFPYSRGSLHQKHELHKSGAEVCRLCARFAFGELS